MLDFGCSIIRMQTASDSKPSNPPSLPNGQAVPTIPVICDICRAEGSAGAEGFAEIEDILGFEPVPRRPQVNSWTPEQQRAFIAALAITGSAARAAAVTSSGNSSSEEARNGAARARMVVMAGAWPAA